MILHGDCIEEMAKLDEASIDAVVCDPPYLLGFMGKAFDSQHRGFRRAENPADVGRDDVFGRTSATSPEYVGEGHAMQEWHQAWATQALRVLKPGGHLLAFGGTRTYHRLACAIEDAGFEIRDSLIWVYGSGFPKSLDVSKAIDKAAGVEREVVGETLKRKQRNQAGIVGTLIDEPRFDRITNPATPEAAQWEGWGTALKPSWENVVVGVKPTGEANIIRKSLCELRAKLLSLSPAKPAGESSTSRPVAPDDPDLLATAAWSADERTSTRADLCAAMGTSQFESALTTSLSIVSSWSDTLDELCELTSTFTTATESGTTTALTTLKSSLSDLTPRIMLEVGIRPDGWRLHASPAVQAFNGVESRLSATRELLALAPATSESQGSSPVAADSPPSHEPIVLARKPLSGTVASNVLEHGTGALNVDGCRVEVAGLTARPPLSTNKHEGYQRPWNDDPAMRAEVEARREAAHDKRDEIGRWPPNLILSHLPECERIGERRVKGSHDQGRATPRKGADEAYSGRWPDIEATTAYADLDGFETVEAWVCAPGCPIVELDAQSGEQKSGTAVQRHGGGRAIFGGIAGGQGDGPTDDVGYGDTGGASRFFYQAKASRGERNAGLDGFEEIERGSNFGNDGARPHTVEDYEYRAKSANVHPTVKPIDLMRWLCRLVTPPGGRILDPFLGSGTTGIAAHLEGFDFTGIEREAEYVEIAKARIEWWSQFPAGTETEAALGIESVERKVKESGQGSLLEQLTEEAA